MMWLRKYSAALGMIIVGIWVLLGSGVRVWQTTHFLFQATSIQGLVVRASAHPVIRFSTMAGTPVQFVQNGFLTRSLGASVPVVYSAHDPAGTARAATFWTLWGPALWLLPMGLGFTILPLLGTKVAWRWGRF
ncbi:hypothetical protein [Deinococcus sp. UYEF24]